jgi:hypothetical protein
MDFDDMARRLLKVGTKMFDIDVANWDGMVTAQLLESAFEVIAFDYPKTLEYRNAFAVLQEDVIHSYILAGDKLFRKDPSVPSGSSLTTILNTIIHAILHYYCYMSIADEKYRNSYDYEQNVAPSFYGDDEVDSVSDAICETFNFRTIRKFYADHNVTVTNGRKNGADEPWGTINDISFLKRTFGTETEICGRFYVPHLDLNVIFELPNWVSKGLPPVEALKSNCHDSCCFAFFLWQAIL